MSGRVLCILVLFLLSGCIEPPHDPTLEPHSDDDKLVDGWNLTTKGATMSFADGRLNTQVAGDLVTFSLATPTARTLPRIEIEYEVEYAPGRGVTDEVMWFAFWNIERPEGGTAYGRMNTGDFTTLHMSMAGMELHENVDDPQNLLFEGPSRSAGRLVSEAPFDLTPGIWTFTFAIEPAEGLNVGFFIGDDWEIPKIPRGQGHCQALTPASFEGTAYLRPTPVGPNVHLGATAEAESLGGFVSLFATHAHAGYSRASLLLPNDDVLQAESYGGGPLATGDADISVLAHDGPGRYVYTIEQAAAVGPNTFWAFYCTWPAEGMY